MKLLKCIKDANGDITNIVLGLDSTSRMQLNADAVANGLTIVESGRDVNGIAVDKVLTPLGTVYLRDLFYLPAGTVALFDPFIMAPVEQLVPGKGNFFLEELAKTGAGTKKQIFGQIGLDHGLNGILLRLQICLLKCQLMEIWQEKSLPYQKRNLMDLHHLEH